MHLFGRKPIAPSMLALIFTGPLLGGKALPPAQNPAPQAQSPSSSKPTRHDSVDVVATLSPEEVAEGKLNDVYQSIAQQQRKGTCAAEIVERYRSEILRSLRNLPSTFPRTSFFSWPTETSAIVTSLGKTSWRRKVPSKRFCNTRRCGPALTTPPTRLT